MLAIWLHVCIILHSYAIDLEESLDLYQDEFLIMEMNEEPKNGRTRTDLRARNLNREVIDSECNINTLTRGERDMNMLRGREFREQLKSLLIASLVSCT